VVGDGGFCVPRNLLIFLPGGEGRGGGRGEEGGKKKVVE